MSATFRGLLPLLCLLLAWSASLQAASLDRAELERRFPSPLVIGERDPSLPVWPVFKSELTSLELVGYLFESIDLAPVPGFSGVPPNLLIALKTDGTYLDVQVVSHHEPVFLEGLGEEPLNRFVGQYAGLGLRQSIKIGSNMNSGARGGSAAVYVDGVAKATASVRVINESVLAAALKVARAKLGFAAGRDPGLKVEALADRFEPRTWQSLVSQGLVRHAVVTNREVEAAFAGTTLAGVDPTAIAEPDQPFLDLHIAYLNTPITGRNLLGEKAWAELQRELEPGHHAILVLSSGRWDALGPDFVRGAVPDRLTLQQDGLQFELRDSGVERHPVLDGAPQGSATVLRVFAQAGLDPSRPWQLGLRVARERGQIFPERDSRSFEVDVTPDASLFRRDEPDTAPPWLASFQEQAPRLGVIAAALAILSVALSAQRILTANPLAFRVFRVGFLVFTLVFLGWIAQAQLSVVTLAGLVRAASQTGDLGFLLYDPPSLLLWGFTLVTLVAWGRGTFCGWLCPFGALQELARLPAEWLRLRQFALPHRVDLGLRGVKYAVLALVLASALLPQAWAETVAEIEPFKTSITLGFDRSLPFVLYAGSLIVLNLFVHKAFCRYLCPLGAALALGGRLRIPDWLARRKQCGTPCQLCRVRCKYGAIERSGRIDYAACFQCMDCVVIHNDRRQCVPLILADRRASRALAEQPR